MRILNILTVYNEINYLPLKINWCASNGLDVYVIDNMSNDGTWEYLKKLKVPSHRFDTYDSFDLRLLQDEIIRTIHIEKPDWVLYNGADLFYCMSSTINMQVSIETVDLNGFNLIELPFISMYNTGETFKRFKPFDTYFYYKYINPRSMIHKYHPDVVYEGDDVYLPDKSVYISKGLMVNFGQTKSKKEREETLERRTKAWSNGLKPNYGKHYKMGESTNWTWSKDDLKDIRLSEYVKYIKKIKKDCYGYKID